LGSDKGVKSGVSPKSGTTKSLSLREWVKKNLKKIIFIVGEGLSFIFWWH
jgi:hypothetical protein